MKNKAEFKKGDMVTFKAYEKPIKAKVIEAEYIQRFPSFDWEWSYTLEGISEPLTSRTSGRSIMESALYVEFDPSEPMFA